MIAKVFSLQILKRKTLFRNFFTENTSYFNHIFLIKNEKNFVVPQVLKKVKTEHPPPQKTLPLDIYLLKN